ncbi:MAG: hypothetical protein ACOVMI_01280 [Chitinophagaceae bacterium]
MKKLFFIATFLLPFLTIAQRQLTPKQQAKAKKAQEQKDKLNKMIKAEEEGALVYLKQNAFGFNLNTDGFGITIEKGKYKTIKKTNLWWISLGERYHPKEERISSSISFGGLALGNPFKYGKINNFYYFKLGFGQQKMIGSKSNKNGIAVSAIYGGGLSLGLIKPYYISIFDASTGKTKDIKYSDDNAAFLNAGIIDGGSGLGKGFNEMKINPGLHARAALRFDHGKYNDMLSAIELGVNVEYYTQSVEQMVFSKDRKLFFNGYVSIFFGRRK